MLIPIKNVDGMVSAILCVQRPMEELNTGRMDYLKGVLAAAIILIPGASLGASAYLKSQIIRPLDKIVKESKRFAKESTKIDGEDLEQVSKITEIRELGNSVQMMEDDVILYMVRPAKLDHTCRCKSGHGNRQ